MEYKGKQIDGRDIATVELLAEIKAYFSEDGAALNALALGGVSATSYALKTDVAQSIADLVGSAPDSLNTIQELAEALKNNKDIVDTLDAAITAKADQTALDEAVGRITTLENSATKVSFAQTLSSGTKIGSITIDGTATNIYAPSLSGYATQSDLDGLKMRVLVIESNYITGITSNMITTALGYQPISQTWINNQHFAKSADVEAVEAMFDSYYKKSEVYTKDDINDIISDFNGNFLSVEGGQIYGDLRLKPQDSNYGCGLYFGDESFSYIAELSDDKMTIFSGFGISIGANTGYSVDIGATLNVNGTLNASQGVVIPTGKTLKIGDATLSWDSTNKALKVDKPMYSTGTIASGGVLAAASQLATLEARVKALEDKVEQLI